MKKLLLFLLLLPSVAYCDDSVYRTKLVDPVSGQTLPNALVTVCASTASMTVLPCTPVTTIHTTAAGNVNKANPFRADGQGNVEFYGPAETVYVISITGAISPGYSYKTEPIGGGSEGGGGTGTGSPYTGSPGPTFDVGAYEGVSGYTCPSITTTTGTISSGSATLSVADGSSFSKPCGIAITGAGAATTTTAPTGVTATYTPPSVNIRHATDSPAGIVRSGNVVTVTLMRDVHFQVGDVVTIASSAGCAATANGDRTVASVGTGATSNQFTFAQVAADCPTGGDGTVTEKTGSTTYTYRAVAIDKGTGMSAQSSAASVTNATAALTWDKQVTVSWTCPANAVMYAVYETTGSRYLGTMMPCYLGNTTQSIVDYGQSNSTSWPFWMPATPPMVARNQALITTISAISGNTITIAEVAGATATGQTVIHDDTAAIKAAIAAIRAQANNTLQTGGGTVFAPSNVNLRFGDLDLERQAGGVGPYLYGTALLKFCGTWLPWMTINIQDDRFNLEGCTDGSRTSFQKLPASLVEPNGLNPVIKMETVSTTGSDISNLIVQTNHTGAAGTALLAVNGSDAQITNMSAAAYDTHSVSSPIVIDACTNGGGTASFNVNLSFVQLSGDSNADYPSIQYRCASGLWDNFHINTRSASISYGVGALSGGGITIDQWLTEGLKDVPAFKVDFANSSNVFGLKILSGQIADPIFTGTEYGIWNVTGSGSGVLQINNAFPNKVVLYGQPFQVGIFDLSATGSATNLGDQDQNGNAFIADSFPPTFVAHKFDGSNGYPAYNTRYGFPQFCDNTATRQPITSLFAADCKNGTSGNTYSNFSGAQWIFDSGSNAEVDIGTTNSGYTSVRGARPGSGGGATTWLWQCLADNAVTTNSNCIMYLEGQANLLIQKNVFGFSNGQTYKALMDTSLLDAADLHYKWPKVADNSVICVVGTCGVSYVQILAFDFATDIATGDGAYYFTIPAGFDTKSLVSVSGSVTKVGTTNTTDIQLAKCSVVATGDQCSGTVVDMLSTKLTIDSNENKSSTAATPAVINGANATLATDQQIRVDVDQVSTTPPKGLVITLGVQ